MNRYARSSFLYGSLRYRAKPSIWIIPPSAISASSVLTTVMSAEAFGPSAALSPMLRPKLTPTTALLIIGDIRCCSVASNLTVIRLAVLIVPSIIVGRLDLIVGHEQLLAAREPNAGAGPNAGRVDIDRPFRPTRLSRPHVMIVNR